ncbi:C4-dicarboxylic acid transporter DauA [Brevibacterium ravenspurgense]|uniref:C4-dicarboxylic acid transporter DauA n=1 Tax=Brevibacterium ravenspurgense TaxID=479117 RepID=A0A150H5Z0_9MICO|nr:SulP family inorganic anion transporter [Brevibacterium ravenspurgense]KXZ57463.1 C4-dicarboxylic acid transporter DauA [Brevibacterium ravenspurgense]
MGQRAEAAALRVARLSPRLSDYAELRSSWLRDIMAGITVGIVAIPLALAFAIASGAPAEMGLITGVVAGFVAAIFGGSHVQVSGPTGAMVVILLPIATEFGYQALPIVAIMGGILVIAAAVLKLGRVVAFIPWPVIEGFTLGIAIIIFMQQVPAALGSEPGESTNAIIAAVQSFAHINTTQMLWSLAMVAVVAIIMVGSTRLHERLPGSILAIIAVAVIAQVVEAPLAVIGELPTSLPAPSAPDADLALLQALIGPAFAVAALTAIESLLSARVASGMTSAGAYDGDRELLGQGLAGVASGFFGGMPATGAIARTAVNVRAGARTRLAAIVHALFLAGVVYLASGLVSQIPMVALAGVLLVTAVNMVDYHNAGKIIRSSRQDAFIFALTALITVSFDLIFAVLIGIAVTAVFALRALSKTAAVEHEEIPEPHQPEDKHIAIVRFDGALYFGIGDRILTAVEAIEGINDVDVVILKLSQLRFMDSSGARVLAELIKVFGRRKITVIVKGLQERHKHLATSTGVLSSLREDDYIIASLPDAVAQAREIVAAKRG